MRTTLRSSLFRSVTLMILPADSARAIRLRLPVLVLAGIGVLWAGSLGAAAWLAGRRGGGQRCGGQGRRHGQKREAGHFEPV